MTNREPTVAEVSDGITQLTTTLVAAGLVDDQEYPAVTQTGKSKQVSTANAPGREVITAESYSVLYDSAARSRAFNWVMLDRALVHFAYEFEGRKLIRHRLSFLPSPELVEFQSVPDLYLREQLYAEVVGPQQMAVPLRFDYDVRPGVANADHSPAHLTIGQYRHCRVPVSAALTPWVFADFLIRHFYESPGMKKLSLGLNLERRFDLPSGYILDNNVHLVSPGARV